MSAPQLRRGVLRALLVFMPFILGACANRPAPLYQWESYQAQVYQYYKGESPEQQILALEADLEKMRAKGHTAPPGLHAHLGMLYAEAGNDSKAVENLSAEKAQFPESSAYVDLLMKKYSKN